MDVYILCVIGAEHHRRRLRRLHVPAEPDLVEVEHIVRNSIFLIVQNIAEPTDNIAHVSAIERDHIFLPLICQLNPAGRLFLGAVGVLDVFLAAAPVVAETRSEEFNFLASPVAFRHEAELRRTGQVQALSVHTSVV